MNTLRMLFAIGFCGGFTTFSTFSYETVRLVEGGSYARAATYIVASVVLSLLATFAGFAAAARVLAPSSAMRGWACTVSRVSAC